VRDELLPISPRNRSVIAFAELRHCVSNPNRSGCKMKADWQTAETQTVIALFRDSLKDSIADHQRILDLLLQRQVEPLELGDLSVLLEDASNVYMAMSESVSQKFLISRHRR
jgi:hypothetical protein